jgi:hypothetical protein
MIAGFEILNASNTSEGILKYREKGAVRGAYLGFPELHEYYTMSLSGVTDWTGFPQSGKSEILLECLLNTSLYYGWKHLLYVPDIGDKNEILAILIHKITGKTFDKRYENSNYISEGEVIKELDWVLHHFRILHKTDLKSKITPYQFWDLAVELNNQIEGGIQTASIDSWKDMKHDFSSFGREDKYLEDVLSYRNSIAETHKIHLHTVIHPRGGTDKDSNGVRKPPKPDDLKGGSEWWNNGKCMITIHRPENSKNGVDFIVTKAKPKSVAKQGKVQMFFDFKLNKYYWDNNGQSKYASPEYVKPVGITINEDDDDLPF